MVIKTKEEVLANYASAMAEMGRLKATLEGINQEVIRWQARVKVLERQIKIHEARELWLSNRIVFLETGNGQYLKEF